MQHEVELLRRIEVTLHAVAERTVALAPRQKFRGIGRFYAAQVDAEFSRAVRDVLAYDGVLSGAAAPHAEGAALRGRHRRAPFDALFDLDAVSSEYEGEVAFKPYRGARTLRQQVGYRQRVERRVAKLILSLPDQAVLYKFRRPKVNLFYSLSIFSKLADENYRYLLYDDVGGKSPRL